MAERDLHDIARLWLDEPTPQEQVEFRDLAGQAMRRARFLQYAELAWALLLMLAATIATLLSPAPATVAIGALCVAALGGSAWKRHRLADAALLVTSGDRGDFVELEARRVRARLRHSSLGLWLFLPGFLGGALFAHRVIKGGGLDSFLLAVRGGAGSVPGVLLLLFAGGYWLVLLRGNRRIRRQLARLEALRHAYRAEVLAEPPVGRKTAPG